MGSSKLIFGSSVGMGMTAGSGWGWILRIGRGGLTLTVFGGGAEQEAAASASPSRTCLPLKPKNTPKTQKPLIRRFLRSRDLVAPKKKSQLTRAACFSQTYRRAAFQGYCYRPKPVRSQGRQGGLMRMAKRIVGTHGNHTDRSFWPHLHAFAPMVRDLQDVDPIRHGNAPFNVAG